MGTDNKLVKGQTLEKTFTVFAHKTANAFSESKEEQYANVLGTPFLIADMERVCAKIMNHLLSNGEVSVGAHIDVRHIAPTGVGASYIIQASFEGVRWGLYTFAVEATDSVGVIGRGKIVRAIGKNADILKRASLAT